MVPFSITLAVNCAIALQTTTTTVFFKHCKQHCKGKKTTLQRYSANKVGVPTLGAKINLIDNFRQKVFFKVSGIILRKQAI